MSRASELLVAVCEGTLTTEAAPARKARIVRRCKEHFDAFGRERLSLAHLAKAAGVSARSLNYAFNDYGISPMRCFGLKRLGRARTELQRSKPERGAIKRIAFARGYTELGRFAAEYRALFVELARCGRSCCPRRERWWCWTADR